MRHTDAQNRATSDPSEGHAVETGQREANLLGIANGDVEGTIGILLRSVLLRQLVVARISVGEARDDVVVLTLVIKPSLKLCQLVALALLIINCRINRKFERLNRGIAIGGVFLGHSIGTSIKTGKLNEALLVRR